VLALREQTTRAAMSTDAHSHAVQSGRSKGHVGSAGEGGYMLVFEKKLAAVLVVHLSGEAHAHDADRNKQTTNAARMLKLPMFLLQLVMTWAERGEPRQANA